MFLNTLMSILKENTGYKGRLWVSRDLKDQSAVKKSGHLHSGDHCWVRWWYKEKRAMYKLSMYFPALGSYVYFSSGHMSGWLELSQAEGQQRILGFCLQQSLSWSAWGTGAGNKGKGGSFESGPEQAPMEWAEGQRLLLRMWNNPFFLLYCHSHLSLKAQYF